MKKKFFVLLFIYWICLGMSNGLIQVRAAVSDYSSCDADLDGFGLVASKDYPINNESNQDPSTLFFAETKTDKDKYYCYLYIYKPQINLNYSFREVQISYLTSDIKSDLENISSLTNNTFYYTLNFLSESSNGTVSKFLVNGLGDSDRLTFRRYALKQLKYIDNGTKYQTLGDDFFYQTNLDNTTSMEWQKMNYVTIKNKIVYSYLINTSSDFWNTIFSTPHTGGEYWFYGFSPEEFKIDQLKQVTMDYYESDLIANKPSSNLKANFYINSSDATYTAKFNNRTYIKKTILPSSVEAEEYTSFFKRDTYNWNRIEKKENAVNSGNENFNKFIDDTFIDSEWIIQFFESDYSYQLKNLTCSYSPSPLYEGLKFLTPFCSYLKTNKSTEFPYSPVDPYLPGMGYYYIYSSKYVEEISILRLNFVADGIQYDYSVITSPIDSSGQYIPEKENQSWWDWLKALIAKIIAWFQNLLKIGATVAKIILGLIVVIIIVAVWKMLKKISNKD